ncbi:MAG: hypothetical protein ACXWP1_03730 [Bdellovibrionota bacterium]
MSMVFRFFLLSLALLCSNAYAVLNTGKATALDQNSNFAGCPAIGAGAASSPQPKLCRDLKAPAVYCAYYDSTPTLTATPEVQAAKKACLDFYQVAVDSQQLICDYERDAAAVKAFGAAAASRVDSAKAADQAVPSTLRCARKMFFYYADVSNDLSQKLATVYRASKAQLKGVAQRGGKVIQSEVSCSQDGTPGYPPGYLLVGLSGAALDDQKKTSDRISGVMAQFGKIINDQITQAKVYTGRMNGRTDGLSTITGRDDGIKSSVSGEDVENGNSESEGDDSKVTSKTPLKRFAKSVTKGTVQETAQESALHAANGDSAVDLDDLLRGGIRRTMAEAAHENTAAFVVSLAVKYLHGDNIISKADMANEIAVFGVCIFGGTIGAPALGVSLAAEVVAYVGEQIAAKWEAYDRKVMLGFQAYAQPRVKQLAGVTSQRVALDYKATKQGLAYCSKCNMMETNYGCPGFQGYVHGYNPDYRSTVQPTNAQPFTNPWMVQGYQQFKARTGGASATTQFSGIPEVSPTATAP